MEKKDGMRGKEWKRRTVCEEINGKGGRYARKRMEKKDGSWKKVSHIHIRKEGDKGCV